MSEFSRTNEDRLIKLLSEELEIFEQIVAVTGHQAELLAADEVEAFEESLDKRQELIEKIGGLHQERELLMQSYIEFTGSGTGREIEAVESTVSRLRENIDKCAGLNESNMAQAKEMAEDYIKRIGKLSLGRKSLGAYAQNIPYDSELFDKKT